MPFALLACVLLVSLSVALEFGSDFFLPGNSFPFDNTSGKTVLAIYLNLQNVTSSRDSFPRASLALNYNSVEGSVILENLERIPDSMEAGIYRGSTLTTVFTDGTDETFGDFTFYKSMSYMDGDATIDTLTHGYVATTDFASNYLASFQRTIIKQSPYNTNGASPSHIYFNMSGVGECDQVVFLDGDEEGAVIHMPLVNYGTEKPNAFNIGWNASDVSFSFISDNVTQLTSSGFHAEYEHFEDATYLKNSGKDGYGFNWRSPEERKTISRGESFKGSFSLDALATQAEVTLDNVILAFCHLGREGNVWPSSMLNCSDREWTVPPPYDCHVWLEDDEYQYDNSTRVLDVEYHSISTDGSVYTYEFESGDFNPITFRIVPMYAPTGNGKYAYPIGPASPVYEILGDNLPGVLFFVIVNVVVLVVCALCILIGKLVTHSLRKGEGGATPADSENSSSPRSRDQLLAGDSTESESREFVA